MKKISTFLCIIFLITLIMSCISFATSKEEITMTKISEDPVTINFGSVPSYDVDPYGTFTKKLTAFNADSKYVDITLTVQNKQRESEMDDLELVLLIDVSNSTASSEKLSMILDCANGLVNGLITTNPKTKVGVVKFATSTQLNDEGYTIEGTEADAEVVTDLTSDKDAISEQLSALKVDTGMGVRTNLDAGIKLAESLLNNSPSGSHNKQMIIFTDAIPNTIIGQHMTAENAYSQEVILKPTRNTLMNAHYGADRSDNTGDEIEITSILIDITTDRLINPTNNQQLGMTKKEAAEFIFGNQLEPTVGPVFYVESVNLSTLVEDIYESMTANFETYTLTDIKVTDVFPEEIVNCFDISVKSVTPPADGSQTDSYTIDLNTRTLTWEIPTLIEGETRSLTYRLLLKSDVDDSYLDRNLNTNDSVQIEYKEDSIEQEPIFSDKTNVVYLTKDTTPPPTPVNNTTPTPVNNTTPIPVNNTTPIPVNNTTPIPVNNTTPIPVNNTTPVVNVEKPYQDPTVAKDPIPQTGTSFQKNISFAGIVVSSIGLLVFSIIRMKQTERY